MIRRISYDVIEHLYSINKEIREFTSISYLCTITQKSVTDNLVLETRDNYLEKKGLLCIIFQNGAMNLLNFCQ